MQRLSPGRARDHPVMEKFLINLSLSLSLSLAVLLYDAVIMTFWTLECFRSSILVRPSRHLHRTGDYIEGEPWLP